MLTQQQKWNRRQFQAALCGGLMFANFKCPLHAGPRNMTNSEALVAVNNAFALTLLRVLNSGEKGKNHFLSPFSIQSALTMATEGARGETAVEMGKALQYPESMKQPGDSPWDMTNLRKDFSTISDRMRPDDSARANQLRTEVTNLRAALVKANEEAGSLARARDFTKANSKAAEASRLADRINDLAKQVDHYELTNANSLWIDKSFKISPKYQSIITDNYRPAAVVEADFRNKANAERLRINQWVSDQTREKIRDIVPPGVVNEMTRLVIANAIYFKGTWATPFNAEFTKPATFTRSDQSKIEVPLMHLNSFEEGKYAAFNSDGTLFETPQLVDENFDEQSGYPDKNGYQVAELPYNGDTISMMIFLPSRPDGLDTLLGSLSETQIDKCASQLDARKFRLSLAKFKLESIYDLVKPLKNLGMVRAFSVNDADFSGLTDVRDPDHELHIAAVLHKAFVDVNERGTEAAAATIIAFAPRSAAITKQAFIPRFKTDHPFLFVIREKLSGLILFIGKVENPSV